MSFAPAPGDGDTPPAPPPIAWDLADPALYANRELSWLDFNERVLEEARDPRNPLLERVRFLAITDRNLDEFYSKRVGWLRRLVETEPEARTVDGLTIAEQRRRVMERCVRMLLDMDALWVEVLEPELGAAGMQVVRVRELDAATRGDLSDRFVRTVLPVLTPLVVDPAHPFPFISGGSLSVIPRIREPGADLHRFARVKLPPNLSRFLPAGEGRLVLLEDLIGEHLPLLFRGADIGGWGVARLTRSIELDEPSEAGQDLRDLMENELERRRFADPVTLEVSADLPEESLELLLRELELDRADVATIPRLVGKEDLFELADLPLPGLRFPPHAPVVPHRLEALGAGPGLFAAIRERDLLVHHPYESFDATVARFAHEAATDRRVLAIKQTVYRTSPDSQMMQSLIHAASRGKQVAVVVELSARLDEANNLAWAERLENAGVHVSYGQPDRKVHSKLTLVVREEDDGVQLYAHIGTGNYNSSTARIYTDLGLFTADPVICRDIVHIFNDLTGYAEVPEVERLLLAPYTLRAEICRGIEREIALAEAGRPARLIFKMNALEDRAVTELLYRAAQAGVQVDLLVRGICRLRPGLPGLSERVRVVSVIGRFLEHSRVLWFGNDGDPQVWIGSADVMERNLDDRVEVVTPIADPRFVRQLTEMLELQLADERQGWRLSDRTWHRSPAAAGEGSQQVLAARAPFDSAWAAPGRAVGRGRRGGRAATDGAGGLRAIADRGARDAVADLRRWGRQLRDRFTPPGS